MKGNKFFINEFDMDIAVIEKIYNGNQKSQKRELEIGDMSFHVKELLSDEEVSLIMEDLKKHQWIPVGKDGIQKNYKEGDVIGSYRLSSFEEKLTKALWNRIKGHFPSVREMKEDSPTDWDNHKFWEPIGINPLLRFIRYNENGFLVPHYDAPFIQDENVRSLNSIVIYLSDNDNGGGTRFFEDEQVHLPLAERDYSDRDKEATNEPVLLKVEPMKGDALVFDHRVLHDSERIHGKNIKTIIRTDIMYRRV